MARPTKTPAERRTEQVKIRLTLAETDYLRTQAAVAELTLAEYVRRLALGYRVKPPRARIEAQLLSELNRIGVNVHQLTRAANAGRGFAGDWEAIVDELERLMTQVGEAYGP